MQHALFAAADSEPGPLVLSYGLGVDSTAIIVEWVRRGIRPDLILHADTGGEKRATTRYLAVINAYLRHHGYPQVVEVRYLPGHGLYRTIIEDCLVKMTLPSLAFGRKACSVKWKGDAQMAYLKAWTPARQAWSRGAKIRHVLGYDAGPVDMRRGKDSRDTDLESFDYPLREWGWNRERCIAEIAADPVLARIAAEHGENPVPPKSSCVFCPAMKTEEVDDLLATEPDRVDMICAVEAAAMPTLTAIEGLWRKGTATRPGSMTAYFASKGVDVEAAARRGSRALTASAEHLALPASPPDGSRYAVQKATGETVFAAMFGEAVRSYDRSAGDQLGLWLAGEWRLWERAEAV